MSDVIVEDIDNVDIVVGDTIQIESGLDNVDVSYDASALLNVDPDEYFLTSSGIYTGRLTGSVPIWVHDAITDALTSGDGNITDAIDQLRRYLLTLENGVSQNVTQIETTNLSLAALETAVVSSLNENSAAIYNLDTTKVTATESQSIALALQQSTFGYDADAYILNISATYTDKHSAVAQDVALLSASFGDVSVELTDTRAIVVSEFNEWDGVSAPLLGQMKEVAGVWYQYVGGSLGPLNDGWIVSNTSEAYGVATTAGEDTAIALSKLTDLEEARDGSVVIFYEINTSIPAGMTYGDYMVDTDSWDGSVYDVYRYENVDGSSTLPLNWGLNTGETAQTLSAGYRADVVAGTAQSTADGKVKVWYQTSAPVLTASDIGDLWVDTDNGNLTQVWDGSTWIDQTNTDAVNGVTWAAHASSLLTAPDGSITGWEYGDGSVGDSEFRIHTDSFFISDGSNPANIPFSVVVGSPNRVQFNGIVNFTNSDMTNYENSNIVAPHVYEQTTKPTSGMSAGDIWVDTDDSNTIYTYSGLDWELGGATPADVVSAINAGQTTTIDGPRITTGSVLSDVFFGNIIYNLINGVPATESNYTMKIDLGRGSIHIR